MLYSVSAGMGRRAKADICSFTGVVDHRYSWDVLPVAPTVYWKRVKTSNAVMFSFHGEQTEHRAAAREPADWSVWFSQLSTCSTWISWTPCLLLSISFSVLLLMLNTNSEAVRTRESGGAPVSRPEPEFINSIMAVKKTFCPVRMSSLAQLDTHSRYVPGWYSSLHLIKSLETF